MSSEKEYLTGINAIQGPLYGYIRSMLTRSEDAWDVLQETNLVLWKKSGEFKAGTNFKAWAYKIAYYQTLKFIDRKKNSPQFSSEVLDKISSAEVGPPFEDQLSALELCLSKLTSQDNSLLTRFYNKSVSLKDQAKAQRASIGSIKQRLFRIRAKLRSCIKRRLETADG